MDQADGTGWMALYAQTMLQIAVELAGHDPVYEPLALKFFEHSMWIGSALGRMGDQQDDLWDEEDGFFYDVLRLPDGTAQRLKVRSMVGLLPLCAATVFEPEELARVHDAVERGADFLTRFPQLVEHIALPNKLGHNGRTLLAVLNEERLRRVLHRMLDEEEFLSPFGIRSLSRHHRDHPFQFQVGERSYFVGYHPAESESGSFGGNSNWRGPVWMPMNLLIVRALLNLYRYYGDGFTVECPTGSGRWLTLQQVAAEISRQFSPFFIADRTASVLYMAAPRSFKPTRTGATSFCFTNTSTETTAPASAQVTRRDGQARWRSLFSSLDTCNQRTFCRGPIFCATALSSDCRSQVCWRCQILPRRTIDVCLNLLDRRVSGMTCH